MTRFLPVALTQRVVLGAVAAALFVTCTSGPPARTFSQGNWQQAAHGSDERYAMAKDIVARKLLVGRSLADVETMLGDGHFQEATGRATYYLGGPTGLGLGNYLVVEFSPDGKVNRTFIYQE